MLPSRAVPEIPDFTPAPAPTLGRGAASNTPNRFETTRLEPIFLDDADHPDDPIEGAPTSAPRKIKTIFYRDHSRTVLSENKSPDVGFQYSVNPYRGCEHGCIYCYARPTHEYLGFSAGIDFETRIMVKEDAPALLRERLLHKSWQPQQITLSGVTDCYQPIERRMQITRRCLEVLSEFGNPFSIITKNHLVTRDVDIIGPMASQNAAAVFISITSLDPSLTEILEPRTSRPRFRLKAVETLAKAGVPVGVMIAPLIPGLNDHEVPAILAAAAQAGARFAGYTIVRLPLSVLPLFTEWLELHRPESKDRILSRLRSMRDGKLNESEFGKRMRGEGVMAEQLRALFNVHVRRNELNRIDLDLSTAGFQRPGEQLGLFR